jgi:hypothetical protein
MRTSAHRLTDQDLFVLVEAQPQCDAVLAQRFLLGRRGTRLRAVQPGDPVYMLPVTLVAVAPLLKCYRGELHFDAVRRIAYQDVQIVRPSAPSFLSITA